MGGDRYTCASCGRECLSAWSEEEARAEYELTFGTPPTEDTATVCDDCYRGLLRAGRLALPLEAEAAIRALLHTPRSG